MKYAEEPTKFNYGPYTVEKAASGRWVWTHPDHEWGSLTKQEYVSPFACFEVIDTIEGSQQSKGPILPEREYYTQEPHTAGATLGFHKPGPATDIQDMMLKLNSMIVEQKNPTDIYHHISMILSRLIWAFNVK